MVQKKGKMYLTNFSNIFEYLQAKTGRKYNDMN